MVKIPSWLQRTKKIEPLPLPPDHARTARDLLRENLALIPVDMYYREDPLMKMNPQERALYLKKFFDLFKDTFLIDRIKYHTNMQAKKTLKESGSGIQDIAGANNINGMAFILDDIEKLANMHIKETAQPKPEFNKFDIIPKGNMV